MVRHRCFHCAALGGFSLPGEESRCLAAKLRLVGQSASNYAPLIEVGQTGRGIRGAAKCLLLRSVAINWRTPSVIARIDPCIYHRSLPMRTPLEIARSSGNGRFSSSRRCFFLGTSNERAMKNPKNGICTLSLELSAFLRISINRNWLELRLWCE